MLPVSIRTRLTICYSQVWYLLHLSSNSFFDMSKSCNAFLSLQIMASTSMLQAQHSNSAVALVHRLPSPDARFYVLRRLVNTNFKHGLPWHNCDYFPAPERRGRGRKIRAAKHLIVENHWNIGLCRLPTELLTWIGDQISGEELLALRATCRQMRAIVPLERNSHQPPVSRNDRVMFVMRMYIDRYRSMADCELYRGQSTPLTQTLPCSFCLALHPRTAFTRGELRKSPYERVCKGIVGHFRMCEHRAHSSIEFMPLLRHINGSPALVTMKCMNAVHRWARHFPESRYLLPKLTRGPPHEADVVRVRKGFIMNFNIRSHSRRRNLSSSLAPSLPMRGLAAKRRLYRRIDSVLAAKNEYICPHLRTSSPSIWRHESPKPRDPLHDANALKDGKDADGEDGWARFAVCGEPNCETRFGTAYIYTPLWYRGSFREAVVFQIWRRVPIGDARDKRWLAQIEGP